MDFFSPARFFLWIFIGLSLSLGAGLYWKSQGENQGQAAETINTSKETVMTSSLVGYWTLDGNDIVWGDANEIKDVNPGTKHDGNVAGSLAAGSVRPGRTGQGLLFNGSSDTVSLGSVYNGVKTVAFWVKPGTTTEPFIDLNGTATIDMTSGVVAANNFATPTVYVDGAALTGVVSAAPTFVAEYPTAFNNATSPKTAMNAVSINSGDVLVLVSADEGNYALGETENGSASWVNIRYSDEFNYAAVRSSGYTATANETLTATITSTGGYSGGNIIRFSGSDGIGASAMSNGTTGTPSVSITTTQANSAIVVIVGDWSAVSGTQTFTNNGGAGSPTNLTDFPGDNVHYGVGIAYYPDAGAAGSKTVGMSAPTGQKWTIHAIEVKGTETGDAPLDTEWHHIAVTTATGINASAVNLGKIASSYFGGVMDDIRFYSTEFTATQVADLYRASGAKEVSNANHREALTNGLVGYWTFDGRDTKWSDTGSEVKDISGNNNHGDAFGITAASVTPGKLGQGMRFGGADDAVYAAFSTILNLPDSGGSAFVWVKFSDDVSLGQGKRMNIFRKPIHSNWEAQGGYQLFLNREGPSDPHYLGAFLGSINDVDTLYGTTEIENGQWYHVGLVWNSDNEYIYLNGSVDGEITRTKTIDWQYPDYQQNFLMADCATGTSCDYSQFFLEGSLDDMRLYNRALSATEVANLYNLGR